ncbi:MAG TPA: universal stress protein [Gemmatimonadaceae bacterium]|jgi:nucleotide-binding universal stress UspA family protein|nr:universal stress protein [Gemmatimonadaceae bacterium]
MYKRILVPLENSAYDAAILEHVRRLAKVCGSSLLLIHVADGWVARNLKTLNLRDSEEMRLDRAYLEKVADELEGEGYEVDAVLAGGDPAREIIEVAERDGCDLIAMSTHGHRFFSDLLYGSVADSVRHRCTIPVLLVRGSADARPMETTT